MYFWDNLAFIFHLNIIYFLFFSWLRYPYWAHREGAYPSYIWVTTPLNDTQGLMWAFGGLLPCSRVPWQSFDCVVVAPPATRITPMFCQCLNQESSSFHPSHLQTELPMPLFTYFTIFSVLFLQVFKEVKPTIQSNIIDLDKAVQISKMSSGW